MRCTWTRGDWVRVKEGILFMCLMVSASAMDSENPIIPGMICVLSAVSLLVTSRKEGGNDSMR